MDEISKVVDILKIQLNTDRSQSRAQIIFYLLEVLRENDGEDLVAKLVYNGIISDLLQNLNLLSNRDFLECLVIIIRRNAFYTNGLVDQTIQGITKYHLIDSVEQAALAVNIIVSMVTKVFLDFTESQGILLIQKHEEGLLSFIERAIFDSFSILSATKLFNFLIKYCSEDFKYSHVKDITLLYDNIMKFLITAIDVSEVEKLKNICFTSFTLANFSNEISEEELENKFSGSSAASSVIQIPEFKKYLIETIRRVTLEFLLPLPKCVNHDFDTVDLLVEFLNTAIKLYTIKDEKLCADILSRGYLKYLLELSAFYHESTLFRDKICSLMSEIIVVLKDHLELPVDNWQGGLLAFQLFLRSGFETLPIDCKQWENILKIHSCQADSLLILIYCHYIGTGEIFIVTLKALTVKLTSVVEKYSESIFLKAIWLLFSTTALESKISMQNDRSYSKAVKRLATLLQKQEKIEMAYTHNENLLVYAITETDFPESFRIKTISLWLDNSKNNKDWDTLIKKCLEEHYSELKIVKLLMAIIHENHIKDPNNALNAYVSLLHSETVIPDDVIEFVWKTLADDLPHYSSDNSEVLKTILRMAGTLPTSKIVSKKIIRKCASEICKIVPREGETDVILKTLLITAASFTIRQSVEIQDSKVSEIYFKNNQFLKEIYKEAFSFYHKMLTEMSLRTLSCLMVCQIIYNLQCNTVSEKTFEDLNNLLKNLRENQCSVVFGLEFVKFTIRNRVDNPIVRLKRLENNEDLRDINYLYMFIHIYHSEIPTGKEGQTYQCLTTILNFCSQEQLDMSRFLMCPNTPLLINGVIKEILTSKEIKYHFLNFVTVWLDCLKTYETKTNTLNKLSKQTVKVLKSIVPLLLSSKDHSDIVYDFIKMVHCYGENWENENKSAI